MIKKKCFFLDRDGVINKDIGYVYKISDFKFYSKIGKGIKYLNENNFIVIIITNQSGIGRKYFNIQKLKILHNYMKKIIKKDGGKIHDILMNVKSHHDISNGINIAISKNVILGSEKKYYSGIVSNIINHQKVKEFFNPKLKSYNELEVLNDKGDVFRIDRVVEMEDKSLHIIDYKTGHKKDEHILQVENYKNILNKIYDKNIIAYLVYIDLNKIIEV